MWWYKSETTYIKTRFCIPSNMRYMSANTHAVRPLHHSCTYSIGKIYHRVQ